VETFNIRRSTEVSPCEAVANGKSICSRIGRLDVDILKAILGRKVLVYLVYLSTYHVTQGLLPIEIPRLLSLCPLVL
jgi:hypothetical protein